MIGWIQRKMFAREAKSLANPTADELSLFTGIVGGSIAVSAAQALQVPAVSAAVRTISEAAATLYVTVTDRKTGKAIPDHPVAVFLQSDVNDWTSGFELVRDLVAAALTNDAGGLAWVNRVNDKPAEIIQYRPGRITVELHPDTGEPSYKLASAPLNPTDVLHLRGPFDRCPLSLAREAIGLARTMERRAGKLFQQGARPGGVIEFPNRLDAEAFARMKQAWREVHENPDETGRTAILWDGAKFNPLEFKSTDQQFLEIRRFQVEEIGRAFNIPATFLGDLTRATWSNLETKNREFLSYCLEPWLRALEAALTRSLLTADERRSLAVRIDRDDLTRASLTERATAINSLRASEVLSADEGRDWLGLGPRADGKGNTYENPNITVKPTGVA
ncbi:MAG: phage portal protein [Phyllobacteriaceae bacterium]|nr:phage portal protein [Phyllobacteriaceae bacterium]MBA89764.1 phage portal protein [Phyllobacteriaceae bacterium]